jgi:hypothetical protein
VADLRVEPGEDGLDGFVLAGPVHALDEHEQPILGVGVEDVPIALELFHLGSGVRPRGIFGGILSRCVRGISREINRLLQRYTKVVWFHKKLPGRIKTSPWQ